MPRDHRALGSRIAAGRTSEVYLWGQTQVLKLCHDWMPLEVVEHEARIAHAVEASGVPVPAVGEVVKVNGRFGIVYERVPGPSMQELMQEDPSTVTQYSCLLAELHADLHARRVVFALPSQRERLRARIIAAEALPTVTKTAALERLTRLPEDGIFCHGDFHPANILMADRGPVIIDWIDATWGNAAADVARTWVLFMGHTAYPDTPSWVRPLARTCCEVHLRRYCELRSVTQREVEAWIPVVAAARLSENIPEAREWLLSIAAQLT